MQLGNANLLSPSLCWISLLLQAEPDVNFVPVLPVYQQASSLAPKTSVSQANTVPAPSSEKKHSLFPSKLHADIRICWLIRLLGCLALRCTSALLCNWNDLIILLNTRSLFFLWHEVPSHPCADFILQLLVITSSSKIAAKAARKGREHTISANTFSLVLRECYGTSISISSFKIKQ